MTDFYNVECTAIPDGIHDGASGRFARVSVILRPEPRHDAPPAGIEPITLLDWVEAIANLDFEVSFGEDEGSLRAIQGVRPEFDPPGFSDDAIKRANEAAAVWWKAIWSDPLLQGAYRELMTKSPKSAAKVETYSYSLLSDIAYERIASDIQISALAASKSIDPKTLSGLAKARLENPNDPAIRVNDALSLVQRDTFAGLDIGDALSNAIANEDGDSRLYSINDALDKIFSGIRAAIDKEIEASRGLRGPAPARVSTWNPFLPDQAGAKGVGPTEILRDRYASPIFGKIIARDFKFDTAGFASASRSCLGLEAFRRLTRGTSAVSAAGPLNPVEQARQNVSRHIANLQAHPALRKFVRLIIDIPVPLEKIPIGLRNRKRGVVSVKAKPKTDAGQDWFYSENWMVTAFEIDEAVAFFEPCPEWQYRSEEKNRHLNRSVVPSLPLEKGIVQLNIGTGGNINDGTRRFRLEVMDAIAATLSQERAVVNMVAGIRKGFSPKEAVIDEPGVRARGIMLLDTEAIVPAHVSERKAEVASRMTDDPHRPNLLFAEDLIDGYRVDIVAPNPINVGNAPRRRVFPAGQRRLTYDVIQNAFGALNPYAVYASRDEGFIRSPLSVVPVEIVEPASGKVAFEERLVSSEVLFSWTGPNLGLPTPIAKEFEKDQQHLLPSELQVVVTYDFATDLGPILRSEKGYFVLLRGRKINGGSVSSSFAEGYLNHALGDESGEKFTFKHVERTPAPVVLVPAGQILAEPDKNDAQPSALNIVAVQDAPNGPSVRMLVSPNVGFVTAEQQGQFDYLSPRSGIPADEATRKLAARRAERGAYLRLRQNADKGGFPPFANNDEKSQALLFEVVDPPEEKPKKPYYVDRALWSLGNLLKPADYSTSFDLEAVAASDVSFWKRDTSKRNDGFAPENVVPVRLEVVALKGSAKSRIVKAVDQQIGPPGRQITVPVLRVEVGRADSLELEVWTDRLEPAVLSHPALRRLDKDTKAALTSEVGRIASLHEVVKFRIVHPVPLPLATPQIVSLGAVRCDAVEWEKGKGQLRDDQPGAESCFAWGKVQIDRKSTGSLWADCRWIEFDPALYLRRTKEPKDPYAVEQSKPLFNHAGHVEAGRLFALDDIPPLLPRPSETEEEFRERVNTIDLTRDDHGNTRSLAAYFRSSRARKVISRLVARSRFAPPSSNPSDYANSLTSTPDHAFEQYVSKGGVRPQGTEEFWLPATRAPAIPALRRNHGIAYRRRFDHMEGLSGGQRGTTLTHIYRCWLDDRWFDSGPFEKLAIICRSNATNPPDWLEPLLSKWGGDMTMRSGRPLGGTGALAAFLAPDQFVLDDHQDVDFYEHQRIPSILRNVPLPSLTGTESHNVDVALLSPVFDSGAGLWYCDIELKGAPAFKVDLDLSLARYQYHAIAGCHLSKPVAAGGFLLHQPWTFKAARTGYIVEIIVVGPAYTERAPMTQGLSARVPNNVSQRAGLPHLTVELERIIDGSPLPVRGVDGRPVVTTSRSAKKIDWNDPAIPEGCTRWTMELTIPQDPVYRDQLAVRISLASVHANSVAAEVDIADGGLITLPEPMVAQIIIGE